MFKKEIKHVPKFDRLFPLLRAEINGGPKYPRPLRVKQILTKKHIK